MTGVEPEIAAQETFSCALASLKWREHMPRRRATRRAQAAEAGAASP